jgi:putative hemolysin
MTVTLQTAESCRLTIRLADSADDLAAVQRLRWRVFCEELGAEAEVSPSGQLDSDVYDPLCDHLLVVDEAHDGEVVGTYRLLRESVAERSFGFYTAGEYDLAPLMDGPGRPRGELLELGRSCVLAPWRTSATIQLLWRGIADYITRHDIGLMFGCASFHGTDPIDHAEALSWLAHNRMAPPHQRPVVHDGKGVSLALLERGSYDERRAMQALPALVKGYLRVGAMVGEGAFIDRAFNTVDVCIVMPVEAITSRYAARFSLSA